MRCACGHPDCSGRDTADVPVVVNVVINQSTLAGSDDYPAHVPGFGVLAAESARAAVAGTPTATSRTHVAPDTRVAPPLAPI
ncbi:protein of uncharacterised function DUF222 [Mycobacteroides abscessus subsp. bolletii]|nr:protein of uncharacterised function DUF222 [Mycobacteroides abscessus subsp. bolletii]SKP89708.1 protein of uncharacterised function DUF222 [Mycobacteroides abscessus subsp. bolletii]SKQ76789.1 protein of uncharacterised function DUF222 [Mycobacteroides abscessus subsp. bolletii]SKQ81208.1 protein of uncharacterised function DUF222 [Mycobacteroides abscessus subsp. bolletii]